jgi:hypothetical protein
MKTAPCFVVKRPSFPGVKAPRAARSATEKGEPFGAEGQRWANARFMQRDVEICKSNLHSYAVTTY